MSGVQSIKTTDIERYSKESELNLKSQSDSYFYKKKFMLGEGMDRDKMRHYKRIEKIMCSDVCEITSYVKKKIVGQLENCNYYSHIFEKNTHEGCCEIVKEDLDWAQISW